MNWVLVVLASTVAAQYLLIAFTVVPLLARLASDEPGRGLRLARLGAAAFFVGCALARVGIAVHEASDTQTAGLDLFELHVLPHLLQIAGGGLFIWLVVTGSLGMSFVGPRAALAERAPGAPRRDRRALRRRDRRAPTRDGASSTGTTPPTRLYGARRPRASSGEPLAILSAPDRADARRGLAVGARRRGRREPRDAAAPAATARSSTSRSRTRRSATPTARSSAPRRSPATARSGSPRSGGARSSRPPWSGSTPP